MTIISSLFMNGLSRMAYHKFLKTWSPTCWSSGAHGAVGGHAREATNHWPHVHNLTLSPWSQCVFGVRINMTGNILYDLCVCVCACIRAKTWSWGRGLDGAKNSLWTCFSYSDVCLNGGESGWHPLLHAGFMFADHQEYQFQTMQRYQTVDDWNSVSVCQSPFVETKRM